MQLRGIGDGHERVAGECTGDGVQCAQRVLSSCGDVATDSAEGSGALCAAEQPRYFLLHLHHADVPFGQVVVEGDIEVVHESQSFLPVPVETFEQVPGLGLFPPPAFLSGMGGACGQGIGSIAVVQDVLIAGLEDLELGFRQMIGDRPGLIDRLLDVQQAVDHSIGPVLPVLLMYEDQFAQMVRVAQAVCTFVTEVRLPEVVYRPSGEIGQDADGLKCFSAAFGMDAVVGGGGCRGRMQPPEFLLHP